MKPDFSSVFNINSYRKLVCVSGSETEIKKYIYIKG